jgi:FKBP-type peptidyl-prolyl cis-trans isomerase 2
MVEQEKRVKDGDAVKIHFTCKLDDGTVFDTSAGKEPLSFVIGRHEVMAGLEGAVIGMAARESKSVIVHPDQAFGPHLSEKVHTIARDQFPRELDPAVGMKFEIKQEDGKTSVIRVTDVSDSKVTLDTNHPLAGKALFFDIELIEFKQTASAAADEFYKKGIELQDNGELDEAISYYQKAIAQNPKHAGSFYNLGVAFQRKGLTDQAILNYEIAIGLNKDFIDAHHNLGVAYKEKGQFDEALICFQRVLQLEPNHKGAYYNIGNILTAKGRFEEAMQFYRKTVEMEPENAAAHWNIALLNLMAGNFDEGWKGYEWRWKLKGVSADRKFAEPLWDGSDIHGKTILLYTEQGYGDAIQFVRYAPLVARRGARVIIECKKELAGLFRGIDGIGQVIAQGNALPEFDVQYPLLSLPFVFGTTLQNIPNEVPYITADPALIKKWGNKLASVASLLRVGLIWSGDSRFKNDHSRSCSLETFSPLAYSEDIAFYSLQMGESSVQAENPPAGMKLIDYTGEIHNFSDTAAIIENLDLVISVDTAVAHLSGALGKPVWILLPFVPDWRWMVDKEDSPWYPTMRLFRQSAAGEWEGVVNRIKKALDEFLTRRA